MRSPLIRTWIEDAVPDPGAKGVGGGMRKAIAQKLRDIKIGNYLAVSQ